MRILLILFGFVMIFLPKILLIISERVESYEFAEPSKGNLLATRIGGVICIIVGVLGLVL
ncbi:hypothetical protein RBH29_11435 [Herbivorax sp. ANBcel31]|uniref:DUF6199 family natural product biosynthesis protein n=1 Tax=Herbivorax sp. ANBcel31 TaxID=3069754 RepID=UPI0027B6CE1F|nr:DUF6199 family natural product biosynthesis protein [Herbivorax sp. ANBcel31]MDQ2087040.1 hypothetical protein [Herbivorax sp. ANBcel31]